MPGITAHSWQSWHSQTIRRTASDTGDEIRKLRWGEQLELLDWPSGNDWTKVRIGIEEGFVRTSHLVEVAYVKKKTKASYHYREVRGPFSIQYGNRSVWRSRMMTRVHYGFVNVRTDGETIVCATIRETGQGWTVHEFNARFQSS